VSSAAVRVVVGREQVVGEVRAAAPLMADLAAPVTARGPWLTAVLNAGSTRRFSGRPVALVVGPRDRPDGVAFLHLRRRGVATVVTMLGDGVGPLPGGRPPFRLLARDEDPAALLAGGIEDLLGSLRGPWRLRLTGLPMGDPTARHLAARLLDGRIGNVRSRGLVDAPDDHGLGDGPEVRRSTDPRALERWLPFLLDRVGRRREQAFLRATARLHAAIGQLEVAEVTTRGEPEAVLLTLVDGADRWPWFGATADGSDLPTTPGAPLVALTVPSRGWPPAPALRSRGAAR
jgi:hypothetical protein